MRTTVILEEEFEQKIKKHVKGRRLSAFVNQCIREHFEREEKSKRMRELEKAYLSAAKTQKGSEFQTIEIEDWPEW